MQQQFIWLYLLASALPSALIAQCNLEVQDYSFYIKVGSGISVSESAQVSAHFPPWSQAVQGYNAKLGNRAIADLGIGCEIRHLIDLAVSMSTRSTFKYRKFQTPVSGGGSYTREFDLDVTPILFSVNLLGKGIPHLHWDISCSKIYPIIGVSAGVSSLTITNYRTTGLPPTGASSPYESFSAENQYTLRKNFTYTALLGMEYSCKDRWTIGTGYRWYDAGQFKGPRYQRVNSGAAVDVAGDEWKMRFRANEWFIEFKIFI